MPEHFQRHHRQHHADQAQRHAAQIGQQQQREQPGFEERRHRDRSELVGHQIARPQRHRDQQLAFGGRPIERAFGAEEGRFREMPAGVERPAPATTARAAFPGDAVSRSQIVMAALPSQTTASTQATAESTQPPRLAKPSPHATAAAAALQPQQLQQSPGGRWA